MSGCRLGYPVLPPARVCSVGGLGRWPLCEPCSAFWGRPRLPALDGPTGDGSADLAAIRREVGELAKSPVTVLIRTDWTGHIDLTAAGPIKGKAGLVALLTEALKLAEAMEDSG